MEQTQTAAKPAAPVDDKLGQVDLNQPVDASQDDNKAKDAAARAALKRMMQPIATPLMIARVLTVISSILAIAPYVALVYLGGELLSAYTAGAAPDAERVWFIVNVLVGTYLTRLGLYLLALTITHFADNRLRAIIRKDLIDHIGRTPLAWFTSTTSGRVRKAIQDDANQIHMLVAHAPVETTAAVVMPIAMGVYAFVVDWRLGLLALSIFPIYGFFYMFMMRGMGEKTAEMDTRLNKISSTMVEFVSGISVVKAFGKVGASHRNYANAAAEFSKFYSDWVDPLLKGSSIAMSIISIPVMLLVNLGGGALMVHAGWVDTVQVVSVSLIALVLPSSLIVIGNSMWAYQVAGAAALRIYEVIETPQLPEPAHPQIPETYDIAFEGVTFSYGDTLAVDNVTLTLPAGTVTALIGPSGSGKSTLATLIARFADVDMGAIKIGGVDVRKIPTDQLYRKVAFVLQDPQLLEASVWDNITLGKPDATEAEVREAARAAYIDDFIETLPEGYQTVIGGGINVSGGQAQRIAIARALLMDAPILLLDEATAFTDPDSEAEIQQALSRLAQGRTVVAIAHRPASIIGADKIVVMERGQVAAAGTHDELKDEPHYRAIWERAGQSDAPAVEAKEAN